LVHAEAVGGGGKEKEREGADGDNFSVTILTTHSGKDSPRKRGYRSCPTPSIASEPNPAKRKKRGRRRGASHESIDWFFDPKKPQRGEDV